MTRPTGERQRIRRIIRAERARYLAIKARNPTLADGISHAVYALDTLLDVIKPKRKKGGT